jgi:quinol monooxygenase YgiN
MSDQVSWLLEMKVNPGAADGFKSLMNEMVEATRTNEPGTLNYEWSLGEDGTTCHLYECYANSAATMTHLASFGANFAERFLATVQPTRIAVYGNPDSQVRSALDPFGAVYMTPAAGFAR